MTFSPLGLTPLIGVFDMPRSLAFYRDLLGFSVVSASPEVETKEGRFSHWMWLRFGKADIMLNTQYDSNERPLRNQKRPTKMPCSISGARILSSPIVNSQAEVWRSGAQRWRHTVSSSSVRKTLTATRSFFRKCLGRLKLIGV